jgi:ribosomal protein S17
MNKNMLVASIAALFIGLAGTVHAETLIGKVVSIDQNSNSMTLASNSDNSSGIQSYKIVWDESLAEIQQLKNARMGQIVTVDADQNPISRSWKVTSVGGALAIAEKALLRTDGRTVSGEIIAIDRSNHTMLLRTKDMDDKGILIEQHIVWDTENQSVTDKLNKASIGDSITLTADQNVITKNWKVSSIAGPIEAMRTNDIRLLTGEVRQINSDKNFIVLYTTNMPGKATEQTIVWDNDFKQQAKLENAKIGDQLSVRADQNMITRNWKVASLS